MEVSFLENKKFLAEVRIKLDIVLEQKKRIITKIKEILVKYIPDLPENIVDELLKYDWNLPFTTKPSRTLKYNSTEAEYNYETLEKLGDKCLDFVLIIFIMKNMISDISRDYAGYISRIQNFLLDNNHFSFISLALGFDELIIDFDKRITRNVLSDVLEAFIGALYFYGDDFGEKEENSKNKIKGISLVEVFISNLFKDFYRLNLDLNTYLIPTEVLEKIIKENNIFKSYSPKLNKPIINTKIFWYSLESPIKPFYRLDLTNDELRKVKYKFNTDKEAIRSAAVRAIGILARDYHIPMAEVWMMEMEFPLNDVSKWYYNKLSAFNIEKKEFIEKVIQKKFLCHLFFSPC